MSAVIPFFAFMMLVHFGIYRTAVHPRRLRRFSFALGITLSGCVPALASLLVPPHEILRLLLYGCLPVTSLCSLLVYLPSWWNK